MARKLPAKDVVIIGLGWTGSIMAYELADEGLEVMAIERGPWRNTPTDFPPNFAADELRFRIRHELFLRPDQTTFTFRNKMNQTALPIRSWGAFMPPNGVGGGGVHWNAETWRFLPSDFVLRTHLTQRYGAGFLPKDMTIQDWGITWEEIEPYYDRFEYLCGTCGQAGNIKGQIMDGGNPFEGPRSRAYPLPRSRTAGFVASSRLGATGMPTRRVKLTLPGRYWREFCRSRRTEASSRAILARGAAGFMLPTAETRSGPSRTSRPFFPSRLTRSSSL